MSLRSRRDASGRTALVPALDMRFRTDELRGIVARATPLFDRLDGTFMPSEGASRERLVSERIARWSTVLLGTEDRPELLRRWHAAGLDERQCTERLAARQVKEGAPLPRWIATLIAVLNICNVPDRNIPQATPDRSLDLAEPLPFEDILIFFVLHAREGISIRVGSRIDQLSDEAWGDLERRLLRDLCDIAFITMSRQFRLFLAAQNPLSVFGAGPTTKEGSRENYRSFVSDMLSGRLVAFLSEFSVLGRLLAEATRRWESSALELCRHLDADRAQLSALFFSTRDPGKVIRLRAGLSDQHRNGRTVVTLEFAAGSTLVYKPKCLDVEQTYFRLLSWINREGDLPPLRLLKTLVRGNHGWVEHVTAQPCENQEQVDRYFKRAGMLLCLVYALQGSDFHSENLIAVGEDPVLVDLETLLHARMRPWTEKDAEESADFSAGDACCESVLRTGLLPEWEPGKNGRSFDVSGLGATEEQVTGFQIVDWVHPNSDQMVLSSREGVIRSSKNCPTLGGTRVPVTDHLDNVVVGFTQLYRMLMVKRPTLLAAGSPFAELVERKMRFIFRPTSLYKGLLNHLRHPEFLRDGADRSIEMESLARAFHTIRPAEKAGSLWPIYEAEWRSLEQLDIPLFSSNCGGDALLAGDAVISASFFQEPCFDRAVSQLNGLCEEDLRVQTGYLRAAILAAAAVPAKESESNISSGAPDPDDALGIQTSELLAAASAIGVDISRRAIRGSDGSATWIGLTSDVYTHRSRLKAMGHKLYSGRCGVALFLAALDTATCRTDHRDLAIGSLLPLRKQIKDSASCGEMVRRFNLGAGSGLGGIIYGLVRVGELFKDQSLFDDAIRLATSFGTDKIATDDEFDVLSGASGLILGLLALDVHAPDPRRLDLLIACGHHLLNKRVQTPSGQRAWRTSVGISPLTGFSHGAAGVAYALTRLFQATGVEDFRAAAEEAVAYEAAVYSPQSRNWPDYRTHVAESAAARFPVAWCNGATGIGLARLGGLASLHSDQIMADIESSLEATLAQHMRGPDHLCCGSCGRIELLLSAGRILGRPELELQARHRIARLIERQRQTGRYNLEGNGVEAVASPSLFRGTAGIGYECLRLANPALIPPVLLFG